MLGLIECMYVAKVAVFFFSFFLSFKLLSLYATLEVMAGLGLYVHDITWFSPLILPFLICLAAVGDSDFWLITH